MADQPVRKLHESPQAHWRLSGELAGGPLARRGENPACALREVARLCPPLRIHVGTKTVDVDVAAALLPSPIQPTGIARTFVNPTPSVVPSPSSTGPNAVNIADASSSATAGWPAGDVCPPLGIVLTVEEAAGKAGTACLGPRPSTVGQRWAMMKLTNPRKHASPETS